MHDAAATRSPRRCFLLGAVLGTLLDGIHAYGDVLAYPDPAFGRWAWFVPLEFGLIGVGVGLADAVARTSWLAAGGTPHAGSPGPAGRRAGCCSRPLLRDRAGRPAGAVVLAVALGCARGGQGAHVAALARRLGSTCSLAAVLGPAGEAMLSALGAFDYADPDFAGIPIWLPALWANGGFLIRRLIEPIVLSRARARLRS